MLKITEKCPFCEFTIEAVEKYHSDGERLGNHIVNNHLDEWLDAMTQPNNRRRTADILYGNSCHKLFARQYITHTKI